jgi:predicted phage terminase large subunit-like protein
MIEIRPQAGAQERFLSASADICIYGGAAGGGKSWGLLLEPLRHCHNPEFSCVIFRRTSPQIRNPGGLWDESSKLYPFVNAKSRESILEWCFPSGALIKLSHMEHEKNRLDWQGSQIPLICFDELTHFTRAQFMYMLSRNRSVCGIRPYIRATTNPDSDSWVADFISWWIDTETGYPIHERSGVLRYFVRDGDNLVWGNSRAELFAQYPNEEPKSVTFIAASIYDNKILLDKDPGYLSNLKALPHVDRERLLGGNWKIRPAAGLIFKRQMFEIVDAAPADVTRIRTWDLAGTEKNATNDPDWTVGLKMSRSYNSTFFIEHVVRMQSTPGTVKKAVQNTAEQDGFNCSIGLLQDPGQAGKAQLDDYIKMLSGYSIKTSSISLNKVAMASPLSSQADAGNIKIIRAPWNEEFLNELENFPDAKHDDQVDAASWAFHFLSKTHAQVAPHSMPQSNSWKI